MFNLSINRENEALQEAADKAVRVAKKEELKREVNLAYDDIEQEEYQDFASFRATRIIFWSLIAAIAFVTFLIMLTPHK